MHVIHYEILHHLTTPTNLSLKTKFMGQNDDILAKSFHFQCKNAVFQNLLVRARLFQRMRLGLSGSLEPNWPQKFNKKLDTNFMASRGSCLAVCTQLGRRTGSEKRLRSAKTVRLKFNTEEVIPLDSFLRPMFTSCHTTVNCSNNIQFKPCCSSFKVHLLKLG